MKNIINHLWSISRGDYGTSYVYRLILSLLFIFMGVFSCIDRHQTLPLFLFNLLLIIVGLLYALIIFDVIIAYKARAVIEFLSLLPLVINLVLSLMGINDTVDSVSYGLFAIVVLVFSWRAEGAENARENNR